jgi:hypothetical protein
MEDAEFFRQRRRHIPGLLLSNLKGNLRKAQAIDPPLQPSPQTPVSFDRAQPLFYDYSTTYAHVERRVANDVPSLIVPFPQPAALSPGCSFKPERALHSLARPLDQRDTTVSFLPDVYPGRRASAITRHRRPPG